MPPSLILLEQTNDNDDPHPTSPTELALKESDAFAWELFERADALVRKLWPEIRCVAKALLRKKF